MSMNWTPEANAWLKAEWGRGKAKSIAAALGCTEASVRNRARDLGLRITSDDVPYRRIDRRSLARFSLMKKEGYTSPEKTIRTDLLMKLFGLSDPTTFLRTAKRWRMAGLIERIAKPQCHNRWHLTEKGVLAIDNPSINIPSVLSTPPRSKTGRPANDKTSWSKTENNILLMMWGNKELWKIAKKLQRNPAAISNQALKIGLRNPSQGLVPMRELARRTGQCRDRLLRVATLLNIIPKPCFTGKLRKEGVRPRCFFSDEQATRIMDFLATYPDGMIVTTKGAPRYPSDVWGVDGRPAACLDHAGTDVPYRGKGLCRRCHARQWQRGYEQRKREKKAA